jgi:Asp-tRNA(Asn)/Glu-tRNA(Gln) amidotransferase A subunit family amidase
VSTPEGYCSLYDIRPTYGRLPLAGMLPQAPSSDAVGWFARDASTFACVSQVMLGEALPVELPKTLIVPVDACRQPIALAELELWRAPIPRKPPSSGSASITVY